MGSDENSSLDEEEMTLFSMIQSSSIERRNLLVGLQQKTQKKDFRQGKKTKDFNDELDKYQSSSHVNQIKYFRFSKLGHIASSYFLSRIA